MSTAYKPINCDYYDRLEAWATTQADCEIKYEEEGVTKEVNARIEDVYAHDHIEYMRLNNGQVIRLDTIISVNDIPLPDRY